MTTMTASTPESMSRSTTTATLASTRAELFRLRRWPAVWVTIAAWLLLNGLFAYVFNFVSYAGGKANFSTQGQSKAELLVSIMPAGVPDSLTQGMPMFGGAIMMLLGAIVAGNGYGWGTWKTVFTQGPSRVAVAVGSLTATGLIAIGIVLATLVEDLLLSLGVAGLESKHVVWPSFGPTAHAVGVGLLVMGMWAMAGYLLGTIARGPALSVGLGLVWTLVIENLLRGVGESLHAVAVFTHFLPGTAAGSLVGQLIGSGNADQAPGMLTTLSSGRALVTVVAYLVLLPLVSTLVVRRRDVA